MNNTSTTSFIKISIGCLMLILGLAQNSAATFRVGDTATDFTFLARKTFTRPDGTVAPVGSEVRLSDFAGAIVFLEWFAVWCPFCVAAAPQVELGIVDWYTARNGNPHGVPVVHVAVNQEARSIYQSSTDSFATRHGFGITVNDYDGTSNINKVRPLFQPAGQPIFVVINGLTNSPTHRPWQVLVNHLGYGETDFNQELAAFRGVINAVEMAVSAPVLSTPRLVGADVEFTLLTQPGRSYRVQSSNDLSEWNTQWTVVGSSAPIVVRDTNAAPIHRFYRAVTP